MKKVIKTIFIQITIRLYMVLTRLFVVTVLLRAHMNAPDYLLIAAACVSLPLVFVAAWRLVETLRLLINLLPNIEKVNNEFVKEQNKEYRERL